MLIQDIKGVLQSSVALFDEAFGTSWGGRICRWLFRMIWLPDDYHPSDREIP